MFVGITSPLKKRASVVTTTILHNDATSQQVKFWLRSLCRCNDVNVSDRNQRGYQKFGYCSVITFDSKARSNCWKHAHRRYIDLNGQVTTKSSRNSTLTPNKPPGSPRKRKMLSAPSKIVTVRDRIRLLVETNQVVPTNLFQNSVLSVAPAAELLDLARSRFSWIRTKVFQHWNPDYSEDPKVTSNNNDETADRQGMIRQYKPGLVIMDFRWWVWNIWFSLLPAFVIAAYCELRAKHLMYDYHRQQELAQLKVILGEDEFTMERANAIIDARSIAMKENREMGVDERVLNYVVSMCMSFFDSIYASMMLQLREIFSEDRTTEEREALVASSNNATDKLQPTPSGPPASTDAQVSRPSVRTNHATQDSGIIFPRPEPSQQESIQPPVEDLLRRIQQLEARLNVQQQNPLQEQQESDAATSEKETSEAIRLIGQRMARLNQSNIQNRFEMDYKEKWKEFVGKVDEKPTTINDSTSISDPSQTPSRINPTSSKETPTQPSLSLDTTLFSMLSLLLEMIGLHHNDIETPIDSSNETSTPSSGVPNQDAISTIVPQQASTAQVDGSAEQQQAKLPVTETPNLLPLQSSEPQVAANKDSSHNRWWKRLWN
jgi:hypothetical protein